MANFTFKIWAFFFMAGLYLYSVLYRMIRWVSNLLFKNKLYNGVKSVEVWNGGKWEGMWGDTVELMDVFGRDCNLNQLVSVVAGNKDYVKGIKVVTKDKDYIVTDFKPSLAGCGVVFWTTYKPIKLIVEDKLDGDGVNWVRYYSQNDVFNFVGYVTSQMLGRDEDIEIVDDLTDEVSVLARARAFGSTRV